MDESQVNYPSPRVLTVLKRLVLIEITETFPGSSFLGCPGPASRVWTTKAHSAAGTSPFPLPGECPQIRLGPDSPLS